MLSENCDFVFKNRKMFFLFFVFVFLFRKLENCFKQGIEVYFLAFINGLNLIITSKFNAPYWYQIGTLGFFILFLQQRK